jgi:predicted nuclease with TOPRIM domain
MVLPIRWVKVMRRAIVIAILLLLLCMAIAPANTIAQEVQQPILLRGFIGYDLRVSVYAPLEAKVNQSISIGIYADSLYYGKHVYYITVWIIGCSINESFDLLRDDWMDPHSTVSTTITITPLYAGVLNVIVSAHYYFDYQGYRYYQYGELQGNIIVRSQTCAELLIENLFLNLLYIHLNNSYNQLQKNYTILMQQYNDLNQKYKFLENSFRSLQLEYEVLSQSYGNLTKSFSSLQERYSNLQSSYDKLMEQYTALNKAFNELSGNYSLLLANYSKYRKLYEELNQRYIDLNQRYIDSETRYSNLWSSYNNLLNNYQSLEARYNELRRTLDTYQNNTQTLLLALIGISIIGLALVAVATAKILMKK